MNRNSQQFLTRILLALAVLFAPSQVAFAQATGGESKEAWVTSYFLVILCVGLALFVICRPSRRDKKVKKD